MDKLRGMPNSKIRYIIDEWIHSSRERSIMKDFLIDGMTFEEMSIKYGISSRWLKELVARNLTNLSEHK